MVGARGHCLTNLMGVPFWFISNHGYIKFVLCAALRNASSAGCSWKQITRSLSAASIFTHIKNGRKSVVHNAKKKKKMEFSSVSWARKTQIHWEDAFLSHHSQQRQGSDTVKTWLWAGALTSSKCLSNSPRAVAVSQLLAWRYCLCIREL